MECVKSVVFGSTDLTAVNTAITGTANYVNNTSLNYESLTEYDEENEVDDTGIDSVEQYTIFGGSFNLMNAIDKAKKVYAFNDDETNITISRTFVDGDYVVDFKTKNNDGADINVSIDVREGKT